MVSRFAEDGIDRRVDEGVFQRNVKYPGYTDIYEACLPYMEKKD